MGIREQFTQAFRSPAKRVQEQRILDQEQLRASSPAEEIRQREERRLAGMSAEDRAWEQSALHRNREAQERSPR